VFSSNYSDFWNKEYIWSIPSDGGANGGGSEFPGVVLENKGWGYFNGWGQFKPSYDIYAEMAKDGAGNDRIVRSILEYNQEFQFWGQTRKYYSTSDIEAGFQINKYMDPFKYANADQAGYVSTNGDWPTARINFPIMRFAEMLLFRAEAYLMTGQPDKAKIDLDRIRTRSHIAPLDHTPTMADLYHMNAVVNWHLNSPIIFLILNVGTVLPMRQLKLWQIKSLMRILKYATMSIVLIRHLHFRSAIMVITKINHRIKVI
jgi:hypothetical protein